MLLLMVGVGAAPRHVTPLTVIITGLDLESCLAGGGCGGTFLLDMGGLVVVAVGCEEMVVVVGCDK
jgi:hypothetical protein